MAMLILVIIFCELDVLSELGVLFLVCCL